MSMPNLRLGRSRTWPLLAVTSKSGPRYLPMVLALAGDSTMTRFLPLRGRLGLGTLSWAAGLAARLGAAFALASVVVLDVLRAAMPGSYHQWSVGSGLWSEMTWEVLTSDSCPPSTCHSPISFGRGSLPLPWSTILLWWTACGRMAFGPRGTRWLSKGH